MSVGSLAFSPWGEVMSDDGWEREKGFISLIPSASDGRSNSASETLSSSLQTPMGAQQSTCKCGQLQSQFAW